VEKILDRKPSESFPKNIDIDTGTDINIDIDMI
jgi:hypothetical protein